MSLLDFHELLTTIRSFLSLSLLSFILSCAPSFREIRLTNSFLGSTPVPGLFLSLRMPGGKDSLCWLPASRKEERGREAIDDGTLRALRAVNAECWMPNETRFGSASACCCCCCCCRRHRMLLKYLSMHDDAGMHAHGAGLHLFGMLLLLLLLHFSSF